MQIAEATLFVPGDAMEAYKASAPWNKFSRIEAIETGIGNVSVESVEDDGNMYDLTGRRVENPVPGRIYIRKGEKIVFSE